MTNHNSRYSEYLNTPRLVADSSQTTVWRWDQAEPFGVNAANEDPDGNSVAFDLPLRQPGQYFDKETALHYNYFRDYDPSLGRYVESDPIGLRGGLNTYAYVRANPISSIDPLGLVSQGEAGYLGGLLQKGAKDLIKNLVDRLGLPSTAGQDAAAELCGKFKGRKPINLWQECTDVCVTRQQQTTLTSGWLNKCIDACQEYFEQCNKPTPQSLFCIPDYS